MLSSTQRGPASLRQAKSQAGVVHPCRGPAPVPPQICANSLQPEIRHVYQPTRQLWRTAFTSAALPDAGAGLEQQVAGAELGANDAASRAFAVKCAEIADETKCQDIIALHVAPHISWTSYMVFATVFSKPQLLAAMARIERMVDDEYTDRQRQNQPGSSPWECLDYGDVVVHLFTAEQREIYDIEGFYAAAEEVDLPWALPAVPAGSGQPAQPTWSKQY